MIPIAPIVWALYYLIQAGRSAQRQPEKPAAEKVDRRGWAAVGLVRIILVGVLILCGVTLGSSLLRRAGDYRVHRTGEQVSDGFGTEGVLLFCAALSGLLLAPWWTTRNVLLPLRATRTSYALNWLSYDTPGGPALAAAWCLARRLKPQPGAIAWVESRLREPRPPQEAGGSTIAARAFLAAARGKLAEARQLFASVTLLDRGVVSADVTRLSLEWLAADSAARGDWAEVRRFVTHYRAPKSRALSLLGEMARKPSGTRKLSTVELWIAWLRPIRPQTALLLTRDIRSTPRQRAPLPAAVGLDPLGMALYGHIAAVDMDDDSAAIAALAGRWEHALNDEALRRRLATRAAAIGGGDIETALRTLRNTVVTDLAAQVANLTSKAPAFRTPPPLLEAALAVRREKLLVELEDRLGRLDVRRRQQRPVPSLEERREFQALQRAYAGACSLGGSAESAFVFRIVYARLNNFAVWLHDGRKEMRLANVIFRFLETEARRAGDRVAQEHSRRNAAAG